MSIVFDQVTKVIGGAAVIDHVSCRFPTGQITGLQGVNGSGKTMLLRLIAGLIYPTDGRVVVDGAVLGKDAAFPPSLGVLLEAPAFLPFYTGYDNLRLLAAVKGTAGPRDIETALARVGLLDARGKKYRKYSLGMKQRLGIAAAILERPGLLLLDEPTNALDESGVELVKAILREERDRGATVVLACHDGALLEDLAGEIFSLAAGRVTGSRPGKGGACP